MREVEDGFDEQFLSLVEEAEVDAIGGAGISKRPKLSAGKSGDGGRQENQGEGSYMAALRGSRSSLWQRRQNELGPQKKGIGASVLGSRNNSAAPSSTIASSSRFKCGMTGHWARECGGGQGRSVDRADGVAMAKPCPCGSGTCLVLTSNTAKNPGRMFYRCPLKAENGGCNYFEWCDSPSFGFSSTGIALDSQFISEVPALLCPCGAGSCLVLVCKSGKKVGQQFYKCPGIEGSASCGFFKWCNQDDNVSSQSSFSQQFHGSSNISSPSFSVDKTISSCFKCGEGGHWAKDCQNQPSKSAFSGGKNQISSAGSGSTTGSCFKCGKSGHWARDCPAQNYSSAASAKRNYESSHSSSYTSRFK